MRIDKGKNKKISRMIKVERKNIILFRKELMLSWFIGKGGCM